MPLRGEESIYPGSPCPATNQGTRVSRTWGSWATPSIARTEWEVGACVSRDLCRRHATALSGKAGLCARSVCATGKGQQRCLGFLKGISPTVSRGDWFPGDRVLSWVSDWLCSFSVKHKRWKHWVSARSFIRQVVFAQGFWDRCRDWAVSIGLMC